MSNDDIYLSWPWQEHCECTLLYDGGVFLPHLLDSIKNAERSIQIELYICESGKLFDEWFDVLEKKAQSMPVRLLIDSFGSEDLNHHDRQRIEVSQIQVRFFNPPTIHGGLKNLIRDHRKLIIIDERKAYVGGMGILDSCDPRIVGDKAWLDAMVMMRGDVVQDWTRLFEQSWQLAEATLGSSLIWRLRGKRIRHPIAANSTSMARVNASRGGRRNPLLFHLTHRIARAKSYIWLNTPYFFPPRRLVRALNKAARRGVRVEICTAGAITDHPSFRFAGQHYYKSLLKEGVHIYEFQPRFAHVKTAIIDDWCTLGSCNYDRWNNHWNLDANVEVVDDLFREQLLRLRQTIVSQSAMIDLQKWEQRPWQSTLRQNFWFWLGTRLMGLLRMLRRP